MLVRSDASCIRACPDRICSDLLAERRCGRVPSLRWSQLLALFLAVCGTVLLLGFGAAAAHRAKSESSLVRVQLSVAPGARVSPHLLLLTVGGPIYCMQLRFLARHLDASLLCADYGPNRYERPGQQAGRLEDWGDPAYDAAVARLPARLEAKGVKVSKLVVVGVSYSGFANAELVASQPRLRPAALVMIDSYLDLAARFAVLPPNHHTSVEIVRAVGGTPAQVPAAYARRSPSHHLATLASDIRAGMRFVDVWSVAASEAHEFHGATCSMDADARWLAQLATISGRSVTGYATELLHAHALWNHGRSVLQLAGIGPGGPPLPARRISFRPHTTPPPRSYCVWHPVGASS
jgi:hypothetical protein